MQWKTGTVAVGEHRVYASYDADPQTRGRPCLLMLHGALAYQGALLESAAVFAPHFRVVLVDLPGHARSSPLAKAELSAFAAVLTDFAKAGFANHPLWLVGESVGGLLALAMAPDLPNVAGVMAVDPPFATAKLWHVAAEVRMFLKRSGTPFLTRFCEETLGFAPDGSAIRSFVYYPLLDRLTRPALVVTGDVALGLPRPYQAVPCCMDEVDLFVLQRLYADKVMLHREAGADHVLLRRRPERCLEIMRERLGAPG